GRYADPHRRLESASMGDAGQRCATRGAEQVVGREDLLGVRHSAATSRPRQHPGKLNRKLDEFLVEHWLSFCLNHVEQAFDRLFGLEGEPKDYTEFDTAALLRSAQKDRIEPLARAVQGGIYSPNEARAAEDLDA